MQNITKVIYTILYASIIYICIISGLNSAQGYYFGLKSPDSKLSTALSIESKYPQVSGSIISLIRDGAHGELSTLDQIYDMGLTGRVYHITMTPNKFSKKLGHNEYKLYTEFFGKIKKYNLKVLFRTMHEMNGGWYPRSSNPKYFKENWLKIYQLSRDIGLTGANIKFIFSVNHVDMPTDDPIPSQTSEIYPCTPYGRPHREGKCYTWEDYRPGDDYVDIIGVSFYNWGQASYSRLRLSPSQIMYDEKRDTMNRLIKSGKPIWIDEVGTTAVKYTDGDTVHSYNKSQKIYQTTQQYKNQRLYHLKRFLDDHKNNILGVIYFNSDYTIGLTKKLIGEADRSVLDPITHKEYKGIYSLLTGSNYQPNTIDIFTKSDMGKLYKIQNKTIYSSGFRDE